MEYMVIPKDVSITDLYSVDNIYSEQLKGEYQRFKEEQPNIELSESDYLVSTLNPRYFSYDSLYEQQMHIENVKNYLLLGTTIVASIFCPPVILTTMGFIFGALEVGSAIGGRDYLTNRKMDKNERIFRGIFGAMDMLPGVVAITKQFEPGRKLISAISDLKAKSISFVKDTYSLGKTKLNAAYNSMLTKVDDFENAIIRQLDDVLVGNTQLRPAFAGIPSDFGDDVVKGIDDVVKGVDDVVNKQNSSLSRGEYLRQKYNIHLTSEELNYRIELRQYVHDEAERLTMGLSKNQIRKQVGPAVAGVYDPATKKFYLGTNHLSGSKPDDIVEILDIRIKNIPDTIDQSFIRTSGIGSHAELYALNKALLERQKLGLSQNLDDLYVYVVNTYSTTRNPASFMPIPRCPHCEYITQGSKYFPEVLKYGKTAK